MSCVCVWKLTLCTVLENEILIKRKFCWTLEFYWCFMRRTSGLQWNDLRVFYEMTFGSSMRRPYVFYEKTFGPFIRNLLVFIMKIFLFSVQRPNLTDFLNICKETRNQCPFYTSNTTVPSVYLFLVLLSRPHITLISYLCWLCKADKSQFQQFLPPLDGR